MPDVKLYIVRDGAEIKTDGRDVERDIGLTTSVSVSLLSRPGWWGDRAGLGPEFCNSRIHTIKKNTHANRNRLKDLIHEALEWMLDDGLVDDISVTEDFNSAQETRFRIILSEPENDGGSERTYVYARTWQGQRQILKRQIPEAA